MTAKTRVKLKLFLIDLTFELVVNSIILGFALLKDRLIPTLIFYVSWRVFRYVVPKVFHFRKGTSLMKITGCAACSCLVYIIAINGMLPLSVSIFFSVFLGAVSNYILYRIQDYIDLTKYVADNTNRIYAMTEEELRIFAKSKHLAEVMIDTLILRVVHNYRWVEIMAERNYSKTAIRHHRKQIRKCLNIDF